MRPRVPILQVLLVAALTAGCADIYQPADPAAPLQGAHAPGHASLSSVVSAGPSLGLELVANGLTAPVGLVPAPDGSGRLFVADQVGLIRIIEDGELRPEPFRSVAAQRVTAGSLRRLACPGHGPGTAQPDYAARRIPPARHRGGGSRSGLRAAARGAIRGRGRRRARAVRRGAGADPDAAGRDRGSRPDGSRHDPVPPGNREPGAGSDRTRSAPAIAPPLEVAQDAGVGEAMLAAFTRYM
jgi:hypothetical protein